MKIYAIALLRVCYPRVPNSRLNYHYETSWMSMLLPGIPLGKNTVTLFLQNLGKSYSQIVSFMRARVEALAEGTHIAIDGTLKEDNSCVNSLSNFSRKTRVKGTKDITVVFAYDIDLREPICSKVFGGNVLDSVSYQRFLSESGLTQGVVMADKGFPKKAAEEAFAASPDLHWLNPIKRNDKRIASHDMYSFTGMLHDENQDVLYKKKKISSNLDNRVRSPESNICSNIFDNKICSVYCDILNLILTKNKQLVSERVYLEYRKTCIYLPCSG